MFLSKFFKHTRAKVLVALAGLTVVFGTAATISTVAMAQQNEAVETKAGTGVAGDRIFFSTTNSDWYGSDATIMLQTYTYGGGSQVEALIPMTRWDSGSSEYHAHAQTSDTYMYYADTTKNFGCVEFLRYNSTGTSYWDGYSGKMNVSGDNNWISYTGSNYTGWTGTWKKTVDLIAKRGDCQTASSSTGRIFYNHEGSAWDDGSIAAVRAWGGSASPKGFDATNYFLSWEEDNDTNKKWFGYADIPTDIDGFEFCIWSADSYTATFWNRLKDNQNFSLNSTTFTTMYFAYNNGGGKSNITVSAVEGGAKGTDLGTVFFTYMLAAFDTCDPSIYNGYGAGASLYNGWLTKAKSPSSSVTSRGGTSATITEHITAMKNRASGGSGAGVIPGPHNNQSPLTVTLWIVLASGVAGLGAIGTAYFVSKKKKRHQA